MTSPQEIEQFTAADQLPEAEAAVVTGGVTDADSNITDVVEMAGTTPNGSQPEAEGLPVPTGAGQTVALHRESALPALAVGHRVPAPAGTPSVATTRAEAVADEVSTTVVGKPTPVRVASAELEAVASSPVPVPEVAVAAPADSSPEADRDPVVQPPVEPRVRPLFVPIEFRGPDTPHDDQPDRVPEARPGLSSAETLRAFGTPDSLAAEVAEVAEQLRPLAGLAVDRNPEGPEREKFEGRGAYHEVPYPGATDGKMVNVYVKGCGSPRAVNPTGDNIYPGFPSETNKLFLPGFVQDPTDRPRIAGTLTGTFATFEQVNDSAIFAHLARREGWKSLREAVDAGITVPLGILDLPGLSAYLGGHIESYIASGPNEVARGALRSWRANRNMVTSSLLVPDGGRLSGGVDRIYNHNIERQLTEDEAVTVGRTLRVLCDAGFCYTLGGAHAQNIYNNPQALTGHADGSDLACFGDYTDRTVLTTNNAGKPEQQTISAEVCRATLIYQQLMRGDFTTKTFPRLNQEEVLSEAHKLPQQAFWGELLKDIAHPKAISLMPSVLLVMQSELLMAVSLLLVEQHDQAAWELVATQRKAVFERFDDRYGVVDENERKIQENLPDDYVAEFNRVVSDPINDVRQLVDFLRTGNWGAGNDAAISRDKLDMLKALRSMGTGRHLAWTIGALEKDARRNDVRAAVAHRKRFDRAIGVQREFHYLHARPFALLAEEGRRVDASRLFEIMITSSQPAVRYCLPIVGGLERIGHRYIREALAGSPIEEVHTQLTVDMLVNNYIIGTVTRQRQELASGKTDLNVLAYAQQAGLPSLDVVAHSILGIYASKENMSRNRAMESMLDYSKAERVLLGAINDSGITSRAARSALIELDRLAGTSRIGLIPELHALHNASMASYFRDHDLAYAQQKYEAALDYYIERLPLRRTIGIFEPFSLMEGGKPLLLRQVTGEGMIEEVSRDSFVPGYDWLASYYDQQGLPEIAEYYWKLDEAQSD